MDQVQGKTAEEDERDGTRIVELSTLTAECRSKGGI
jgi:hypothetical protein